jgi:hypothetical protein
LRRRNPHAIGGEQQHHQREVGRVREVLAAHAQQELAADREHGGERVPRQRFAP